MYVPLEKLQEKVDSIYKLVILAARRALELNEGMPRLIETRSAAKPPVVALEEIAAGKVSYRPKKEKDEKK